MFIKPSWPAPANLRAYSSLRKGGFSQPPYQGFNLAFHVADRDEDVTANRDQLQKMLQLPSKPIWLNQVHGVRVVEALPENTLQEADASFARQANQVCAILTADCLPILLCDHQGSQAAAIHAGWRGLAKGIIEATLEKLTTQPSELLAWLGPAIGPQKFEVGADVYTQFSELNPGNKTAFKPFTSTTWLADIYELAHIQLRSLGVSAIYGGEYCTYLQSEDFFSFRRDGQKTGRMATLIWLEAAK